MQGLLNLDVSYGVGYRLEDPDPALIGIANGGNASNVNGDDGTLNAENGPFASMFRATGELVLALRNVSLYARAAAFHDWIQDDDLDRTSLTAEGRDLVASGADLLDHYLATEVSIAGVPFYFRLGDQVINWSATTFVRDGLDVINPLDGATLVQPAAQPIDARKPQGMLWFAASPTAVLAIEGYYQYEWSPLVLAPVGHFYSTTDVFGGDGPNAAFLGDGGVGDLGTDLDAYFALPSGTLGFDEHFHRLPGRDVRNASDSGQYGISLFAQFVDGLATKIGFSYLRYHSRLPIVSSGTGSPEAVAATSPAAVAARARPLVPAYLDAGFDIEDAEQAALETAEALTLSTYTNRSRYFVEYPENIHALGTSFSLSSVRTGTLFRGDFVRHFDTPIQLDIGTVLSAVRSPVLFDPSIGDTPLGAFGPSEVIHGYRRVDRSQATLGATKILGPRLGADQSIVSFDIAGVHVHDAPGEGEVPGQASVHSDDSWGYRVILVANYSSVLGGLNLSPRLVYARDIDGTTPAPTSTFVEGRTLWSFGLTADFIQQYEADIAYTRFSGGGTTNKQRDRDAIQLRITYSF